MTNFANKFTGEAIITIESQKSCDFIFLFPKAEVGESVHFGELALSKINE